MRSVLIVLFAFLPAAETIEDSPRSQFESLAKEFETAYKAAMEAYSTATTDEGRIAASLRRPQPQELAPRFFALAEKYRDDPAAIDSLVWIASNCIFGPQSEKALGILASKYSRSERLKDFCGECARYGEPFAPYEDMLRAVLKDNSHREVRARACLALATYLKMAKETTESHLIRVSLQVGFRRGPESLANFDRVKKRGLDKVASESATLFEEVIDRYADVRIENNYPNKASEFAKEQLFELRNLVIGAKAPAIEGNDILGKAMKLSDYRGKVIVLDFGSHRSCGVCRQMYPGLRQLVKRYQGKPAVLLGINVDDDVKELKTLSEKGEVTWPIWWDGENLEGPLTAQWVVRSMPTFYILDDTGVIRNKGFLQFDEISGTVDMLLKEMSPG